MSASIASTPVERVGTGSYDVYVLECAPTDGELKFYVGQSQSLERRMQFHAMGDGSKWTSLHTPQRVVEIYKNVPKDRFEREITLKYMKDYGSENVRGSVWHRPEMHENPPLPGSVADTDAAAFF